MSLIEIRFQPYPFNIKKGEDGKQQIFDIIRRKFVHLSPEEWVRQHIVWYCIYEMQYPKALISVEKQIKINQQIRRYDIVIYHQDMKPWMMIECKQPEVPLTNDVLQQLLRYQKEIQSPYGVITNGKHTFCCEMNVPNFKWLAALPVFKNNEA